MTKRLLSLFLALIMVLTLVPCTVFATVEQQPAETKLPSTGTNLLTIVNDSVAPAKYTVNITRNGVTASETRLLTPKASGTDTNKWEIPINEGDKYEIVDVKYPEYYAKSSDVKCTFFSESVNDPANPGSKSFTFPGGEQTVGSAIMFPYKVYKAYTIDEKGNHIPHGGPISMDDVWENSFGNSISIQVSPQFKGKTITFVPGTFHSWEAIVDTTNKDKVTYTEKKHYDKKEDGTGYSFANLTSPIATELPLSPALVGNSESSTTNEDTLNANIATFEASVKANYKESDGYTFEKNIKYTSNNTKFTSSGKFLYTYQLAEETNASIDCSLDDITLTYTIPDTVPAVVDVPLDVLNAERYDALATISDLYIDRVLEELKASGKEMRELLEDSPEELLNVLRLDILKAAFSTDVMPASSVTLTEISEGDFYMGNQYTLYATNTDAVDPLFASVKIDFPLLKTAGVQPTAIGQLIPPIFELAYSKSKKDDLDDYRKEAEELNGKTAGVLASLASDTELQAIAKKKLEDYYKNVTANIEAAEKQIKDLSSALSTTVMPLIDALVTGIELPIRLGYTYNFNDVRPGKYLVTVNTPDGWEEQSEKQIAILVKADGTVEGLETDTTAGLKEKQTVVLNLTGKKNGNFPMSTLDSLYYQFAGKKSNEDDLKEIKSTASMLSGLVKGLLYDGETPPALMTNTGIWLDHDSSVSAVGTATTLKNSVEFKNLAPDGKPIEGSAFLLINRDQLLDLLGGLVELGKDVIDSIPDIPDKLDFDALKALYEKLRSGNVEIDPDQLKAALNTAENLSNINMPIMLEATSDENGVVRFDEQSIVATQKLLDAAQTVSTEVAKVETTVKGKLENVNKVLDYVNKLTKQFKSWFAEFRKTVTDTVDALKVFAKRFVVTLKDKLFGGFVKTAKAAELPDIDLSEDTSLRLLLDNISDTDVIDVISNLLDTVTQVSGITGGLSSIDTLIGKIESDLSSWDTYVPTKPQPPQPHEDPTKIEELIEQLEDLIAKLKSSTDTLDTVEAWLTGLLANENTNDIAYVVLDVFGLESGRFPDGDYILIQTSAPEGYTRNPLCYTLHVENNVTAAQNGIIAPLLTGHFDEFKAFLQKNYSSLGKAMAQWEEHADHSLARLNDLWNSLNDFFLTHGMAALYKSAVVKYAAATLYQNIPFYAYYYDSVREVENAINAALADLDAAPTFEDLVAIADGLLVDSTTVDQNWIFCNLESPAKEDIPA